MARTVGGVVGAVVGFYVGGPQGAQWGWAIGSAVGGSFETIKTPRIGDLAEVKAGEGGPRARVLGTFRPLGGQVVWSGTPREIRTRQRQGKGGPKVETSTILRSYAIGICEGPITGVSRVWRNNELVYDVRPGSEILAESAEWITGKTILLGGWDQLPHPTIEAEAGAGNAPAMRGTALLVVIDEDLTDLRGAIPAYQFEVNASACPLIPGADQAATVAATHLDATIRAFDSGVYMTSGALATNVGDPIQYAILDNALNLIDDRSYTAEANPNPSADPRFEFYGGDDRGYVLTEDGNSGGCYLWYRGEYRAELRPRSATSFNWFFGTAGNRSDAVWFSSTHVYLGFRSSSTSVAQDNFRIYRWPLSAIGDAVLPDAVSVQLNTGVAAPNLRFSRDRQGRIHAYSVEDNLWRVFDASLALIDSFTPPVAVNRPIGSDGLFYFVGGASTEVPGDSALFIYTRDWTLVNEIHLPWLSSTVQQQSVNWSVSFNDQVIVVQARDRAVTIPYTVTCGTPYGGEEGSLGGIISSICRDASMPDALFDVSAIPPTTVPGFATSPDYTAAEAIKELGKVFFFDAQDADGIVRFIPRGGDFVAVVTEDEFVDGEDEPEKDTTRDSLSVPRLLHLQYFDLDGGQSTDKQFSERQVSPRSESPTVLSTPVVLDAETAARAIRKQHQVMEEELRGELVFGLSDKHLALAPSDVIVVQYRGRSQRCRITKVELMDGWQRITGVRDRQSAYTSTVQPVPPAVVTRPPESLVGATRFAFIDLPALTQAGDVLGYHIATSGESAGWRGAAVEREDAGAQYSLIATDGTGTVMGALTAALSLASEWYPDESNAITVQLARSDDELEAVSVAAWLGRANACAIARADGTAEVIQFRDAAETSPGVWRLSGLQRGRLNSGASAHAIGAVFVLLDGALFVETGTERLSTTLTHRAYSVGKAPNTGTTQARTWTGRSQREWPPIIESAVRTVDSLAVVWTPRHRFGSDENPIPSANFEGWRVTATSGGSSVSADTTSSTATLDVTGLSNPITVTVQGRNRLTGLGDTATRIIP